MVRVLTPLAWILLSLGAQQIFLPPFTHEKLLIGIKLVLFISLAFELSRKLIFETRKRIPGIANTRRRLAVTYVACLAANFLMIMLSTVINHYYFNRDSDFMAESFSNLLQCVLIAFVVTGPYEVLYSYALLLKSEKEKEELLRANLESRFETLKSQVNPHFLFNSLNTLSSLISKDAVKAEQFVLEMSSVYRYLLRNNEERLVPLCDELEFAGSFLHLLETRYGQALQVEVAVDAAVNDLLIAPLTLQMLIENAVKHNVVSANEPLHIHIYNEHDARLVVVNNLQKKTSGVLSEKTGLSNIISRYKLLDQPQVELHETSDAFIVKIPLIKPGAYENTDR